jgi:hypothetical protein
MSPDFSKDAAAITFDGSNWESLPRLVVQAQLALLLDNQVADQKDQSAWVAARFRGPALDWFAEVYGRDPKILDDFKKFVTTIEQAFGVTDGGLRAHRRGQLEGLKWQPDLPVFFAEFDRLTSQLGLHEHETRIALVRNKLPISVQKLLAEQALDFSNYETMRERLLTMWALDPKHTSAVAASSSKAPRPKCGKCGKKGHTAPDCRSAKN